MLASISIKNYALINELHIDFSSGLSIITGETGAGKSILLGALGLVLGNRADSSTLKNTTRKCIVVYCVKCPGRGKFFLQESLELL